jgi:hypothetical protein
MYAITCISHSAFRELLSEGLRTLELLSAHNINSIAHVNLGEPVFVTCKAEEDITRETEGIIAVIKAMSVQKKRIDGQGDEYEISVVRIQLERVNTAKVKDAVHSDIGKEVSVDIEARRFYRIS